MTEALQEGSEGMRVTAVFDGPECEVAVVSLEWWRVFHFGPALVDTLFMLVFPGQYQVGDQIPADVVHGSMEGGVK